jgi:hypothetical protein
VSGADIELMLRGLLHSSDSSITITFNDHAGSYLTIEQSEEQEKRWGSCLLYDWVSQEERARAIELNSIWVCQWYPESANAFHALAASSLPVLLDAISTGQVRGYAP